MFETFDYVIVGAGSAGCVIADRLSEDRSVSVLVLEAGGRDSNPWIHVPVGYGKTFFDKRVNWCMESEPSPQLEGRRIYLPAGKVLGGSSSINGLLYLRGQKDDYDDWQAMGNSGWSWDDVLPYFTRSEDQESLPGECHGRGGPLPVSNQSEMSPLCDAFIKSGAAEGFGQTSDFNRGDQSGLGWFQVTARNGRRKSTAATFLRRAQQRANVVVRTEAMVHNLVIDEGVVTGLIYERAKHKTQVTASRQVILSCGAFNSPALLQRSGIGNPQWLTEAGIPVKHALTGVGANLQDHLQAKLVYRTHKKITLNDRTASLLGMATMGCQYLIGRRGPLTTAGAQSGGFVSTRLSPGRPDIQFQVSSFSSADLRKGLDPFSGMTIAGYQLRPESRGTVKVKSANPTQAPLIYPNFMASDVDAMTLIEGLRAGRRIAMRDPLRAELIAEERPGINIQSNDEMLGYLRATASSVFHPAGTCRMGSDSDAVVDARLKVRGLAKLTIADASIMPRIVSGNTNAACIMIGERAADFLKQEYRHLPA